MGRMSLSICPRCALSLARARLLDGRPGVRNVIRRFRSTQSLTGNSSSTPSPALASMSTSKSILSFLQTLDSTNASPLPEHTVSSAFIQKVDPEITALLKAVAGGNVNEWWHQYVNLFLTKGITRLSRVHFTEILRALHPTTFHESTGSTDSADFYVRLNRIKSDMQTQGYVLGLTEWNHLLDCARASRAPEKAHEFWNEMLQSGVRPDTFSFNNLLAALCGKASLLQYERPVRYKLGKNGKLIDLGKSVSYSPRTYQQFPSTGKSSLASALVRGMVAKGIRPNAYTYEILLIAFARDNDMETVNEIVRRIWGFNPDGTPTESSVYIPPGSLLWPSDHTLIAIANGYGYNGAVAAAIALIEAMSTRFEIRVSVAVWLALLLWSSRRSTVYKNPRTGFISALAAPRLFQVMKSPPYNVNPGIEAYWHMINHEMKRRQATSVERLLVEALKRYGPNGTDLTPDTQHLAWRTLSGVKNWVPILCHTLAKNGERGRAVAVFRRWQYRFHALERTGLIQPYDEVDEEQKTDVPGVFLPPSPDKKTNGPTSLSIRRRLARLSARERSIAYKRIAWQRKQHYPSRWRGPGRPLFLPSGINIQYGLGSPNPRYRRSYALWQMQVKGLFEVPLRDYSKKEVERIIAEREREMKYDPFFEWVEERQRIMGNKSEYLVMREHFERRGFTFRGRRTMVWQKGMELSEKMRKRLAVSNEKKDTMEPPPTLPKEHGMFGTRNAVISKLRKAELTFEYASDSRKSIVEKGDMGFDSLLPEEIKNGLVSNLPNKKAGRLQEMADKMKPFLPPDSERMK